MLNRMATLVTQGANGTYTSTDKSKINSELSSLYDEIERIETYTKFNGQELFDASFSFRVGESADSDISTGTIEKSGMNAAITASTAYSTVKGYIDAVSAARSSLGAIQNRLEHTVNNLGVTMENLQNAESTIRDTNVADEMMKYTKNNILIQSAQAMLAQANQVPQGVLQLMQ